MDDASSEAWQEAASVSNIAAERAYGTGTFQKTCCCYTQHIQVSGDNTTVKTYLLTLCSISALTSYALDLKYNNREHGRCDYVSWEMKAARRVNQGHLQEQILCILLPLYATQYAFLCTESVFFCAIVSICNIQIYMQWYFMVSGHVKRYFYTFSFFQIKVSLLIVFFFWMCKFMPTTNCLCKINTPSSAVPWLSPARWQTLRSTGRSAPERPAGSSLHCSETAPKAPPDVPGHAAYLSPQALVNIKTWTHRRHREDTWRADNQIFSDLWREWASGCWTEGKTQHRRKRSRCPIWQDVTRRSSCSLWENEGSQVRSSKIKEYI